MSAEIYQFIGMANIHKKQRRQARDMACMVMIHVAAVTYVAPLGRYASTSRYIIAEVHPIYTTHL